MLKPTLIVSLLGLVCAVTVLPAQAPAPGFRLFGLHRGTDTFLVDTNGAVVQTWPSTFPPGLGVRLAADGLLLRTIGTGSSAIPGAGGGVQKVDLSGNVVWEFRYETGAGLAHHDALPLPNGNVLMIAWDFKTTAEAIAAGRDPALLGGPVFLPDHLIEVRPTGPTSGAIVWRWHVWDHLIQDFDPTKANYGVVGNHPELIDINYPPKISATNEFSHFNGCDYDPVHDWIVVSAPLQDEVWVIDHSTTSAEAAGSTGGRWGKGGDLLYRWGNPEAHRAGTSADRQLFFPHAPRFVPQGYPGAGNLIAFNNGRTATSSSVDEMVLPLDPAGNFILGPGGRYGPASPTWSYSAPGFASRIMSSADRLPNGNTLVCSSTQGRVFEVTASGQVVWQYNTVPGPSLPFHAHYVERCLWSDTETMSVAGSGAVTFELIAGSSQAGKIHFLTGTTSGTSPGISVLGPHLPLNPDAYFLALLASPNGPPFSNNFGVLDAQGRSTTLLNIPPRLINPSWVGLQLDHAYLVIDTVAGTFTKASNAVPLVFVQ